MGARRKRRKKHPKNYCTIAFIECKDYNNQGKGIVYFKNKPFYIDELIVGEKAQILIYYEENDFGVGRAINLKKPSPERVLPLGHWKFSLGTYHLSHLSDKAQDAFKQKRVNNYFPQALPIIVGKRTYYRNKVSLTNGGFKPPGSNRKITIIPEQFDLMDFDIKAHQNDIGVTIIRHLATKIVGKPGDDLKAIDYMLNKKFIVSLDAFYQVNSEMAALAYQQIIDFVPIESVVFDLFAGAAVIGIHVANKAKKVYSVEINQTSFEDGQKNIEINKINNIKNINQDANKFVLNPPEKADVIIVDPARAGLSLDAVKAINSAKASKIIYLSCNIDTQYRDIQLMTNYQIKYIQPYDFFPQTFHIENLVILDLK